MKLTHRVLYKTAKPVDFTFPWRNERLAQDLLQLMILKNGIGLAAPQVGISRRVFVMRIGLKTWYCFNPKIQELGSDFTNFDEGCLSFPGDLCTISRADTIKVVYQTASGDTMEEELSGLTSRCFQHELDHLDGVTMHTRKA